MIGIQEKIAAAFGWTTLGTLAAVVVEPMSSWTKFGLLFSGALLGALFFVFISITRSGMKNLPIKIFESFAMLLVGLIAGGCLVELLAYRYSLYEHRAAGTLSPDAIIFLILGVSFTIAGMGYEGIKKISALAIDILRHRLGEKPKDKE